MSEIQIEEMLTVVSLHFKIPIDKIKRDMKKYFTKADTSTLDGILAELRKHNLTQEQIITFASEYLQVSIEKLKSKSRKREVVEARQIAIYITEKIMVLTLKDNAGYFGGRDHTTAIHSIQTVKDLMDTDSLYLTRITQLSEDMLKKYEHVD